MTLGDAPDLSMYLQARQYVEIGKAGSCRGEAAHMPGAAL